MKLQWGWLLLCGLLGGCIEKQAYAPVVSLQPKAARPASGMHRAQAGETLYAIAWQYGLDYHELAARNHIAPPYTIHPGQLIAINAHERRPRRVALPAAGQTRPFIQQANWQWPLQGKIAEHYTTSSRGINFTAPLGRPVQAVYSGKVVYCGNGLRGYGNLVILKHQEHYLTAYAYLRQISVKEGDLVRAGQVLGTVGLGPARTPLLHFEIRQDGKPVNPLAYLSRKTP